MLATRQCVIPVLRINADVAVNVYWAYPVAEVFTSGVPINRLLGQSTGLPSWLYAATDTRETWTLLMAKSLYG